ncbi:hypothetical protein [Zobellia galactanivorans]|uniref:Conserved hypothetical periplasmic protein n=1 Tax=Zobellia galactanivorans (strain DSM 12802 / CCUG 47099 / CIP 106680 / NCIMB 13871 / Dsij) TaxID=63186 RepID=G0L3M4_ZOBGA|nr:hypothetical protein [Zobellia galactanivorans]CAZ98511.1 Conserved hypothetical periplasmic protein [Zobellia galactanivorans]
MKNGSLKNSITFLFLALFITAKMAGLHVFSHTDDENHGVDCAICVHINTNNLTPSITPDSQDLVIENIEYFQPEKITEAYDFVVSSVISADQLLSRPPPSLF